MGYYVVEKDVEEDTGFIHREKHRTWEDAANHAKELREELGEDYYEIFIAEME